jgi:predicted metalloprotease with PDZ domain
MVIVLVATLVVAVQAAPAPDLAYRFQLVREPELRVRVRLTTAGNADGTTTFEVVREWGGVTAGGDDISEVTVTNAAGKSLAVEHPEPHRWRVTNAPNEMLTLEYAFAPNEHQAEMSPDENRRPILTSKLFHIYGQLGLMWPGHMEDSPTRHVAIEWDGFDAAGWKVATSFGVGTKPMRFETDLNRLRESVFMAGEIDLLQRDVEKRPVYVAVSGDQWGFQNPDFADLVARVVGAERGFFSDYDYPFFLVTAIPIGQVSPGSQSMGGTGLTNSFALEMLPDTRLDGEFLRALGMRGLLAHEMFHNWNGHTIQPEDPEQLVYWWTEGFTDFYMRRMLLRSGLITTDEYVKSLNVKVAELLQSPVCNAPNERIRADFWRDSAVKRLPYVRGDVVAMIVDGAIRRKSNGKQSLDDLMRALVKEARATGERYTTDELLRRIEDMSDTQTADRIRAIVVEGESPVLDPNPFDPCLAVVRTPLSKFEVGFDFEASRKNHTVTGLVPGSAAAKAGIAEGQKLVGWSVSFGDAAKPAVMTIDENGTKRKIEYLPAGEPVPTPQFEAQPGAAKPECSGL